MACIGNALVVGGGVGGMAAAVALARRGVRCDVVELADAPLGAALTISGRATEALDELGVYDRVRAAGTVAGPDTIATRVRDATGRVISPAPDRPHWPGAKDGVGLYRPVFLDILVDTARSLGVTRRCGVTVRHIDDTGGTDGTGDTVAVTFTDGRRARYDLVVGADGVGSRLRGRLFPDAARPAYTGQLSIRWMAPGSVIPELGWYRSAAGRVWFYHVPRDMVYVPANLTMPRRRLSRAQVFAVFARLLESFTAPAVAELRRRLTADADLIARPFEWVSLPGPWFRGRVVLIGDAAHATSAHLGMGAGMAVEDAVVLAQSVAASASLPRALAAFMDRRWARVKSVVDNSVAVSRLEQARAPEREHTAALSAAYRAIAAPY